MSLAQKGKRNKRKLNAFAKSICVIGILAISVGCRTLTPQPSFLTESPKELARLYAEAKTPKEKDEIAFRSFLLYSKARQRVKELEIMQEGNK